MYNLQVIIRPVRLFCIVLLLVAGQIKSQPSITSFSPQTGTRGTAITIKGTHLDQAIAVRFGNIDAKSFVTPDATTIIATVGDGESGAITVFAPQSVAISGFSFYRIPPPVITSLAPSKAPVGSTITLNGSGFDPVADSNFVFFGSVRARVVSASPGELKVIVPAGSTFGPVTVTSFHQTGYTAQPFIVTFSGGGVLSAGSFAQRFDVETGDYTSYAKLGDLDGDGLPDLMAGNYLKEKIALYRNEGRKDSLSFSTAVTLSVNGRPENAVFGDLDKDGKLDLIVVSDPGYPTAFLSLFRNTSTPGNFSFVASGRFEIPNGCSDVLIHDFDSDGFNDVAVLGETSVVSIFRNNSFDGKISLLARQAFSVGSAAQHFAVGDLDGDGKPDLAVANSSSTTNTISLLRNISSGAVINFAAKKDYAIRQSCYGISIGDLDNDGKPDLAVSSHSYESTLELLKNTSVPGNFSFDPTVSTRLPYAPTAVRMADIDGDGYLDVAISSQNIDHVIRMYRNKGVTGQFSWDEPVIYDVSLNSDDFVLGDLDGTGTPDMVIATTTSTKVSIFRNIVSYPQITSFAPSAATAGDTITIRGRNFTTVSAVTFGGIPAASFQVLADSIVRAVVQQGASGNIQLVSTFGSKTIPGFTYLANLRITGITPLSGPPGTVISISGSSFGPQPIDNIVYIGSVKATVLSASPTLLTVKVPTGADLKEITVTYKRTTAFSGLHFDLTFPGSPAAFLSTSFESRKDFQLNNATSVGTGDFDGDGKIDVAAVSIYNNHISVWRNTGTSGSISFGARQDYGSMPGPANVRVVDYDADGKLDMVVGCSYNVSVYRNTSSPGQIAFANRYDFGAGGRVVAVGDLDLDGLPDIVTLGESDALTTIRNTSSAGQFTGELKAFPIGALEMRGMAIGDVNGDRKPELILSYSSGDFISIFSNTSSVGNISFGGDIVYFTGDGPFDGLELVDFNRDNKREMVTANFNSNNVSVFENLSATAPLFNAAKHFATGKNPLNLKGGDLNGDGVPDLIAVGMSGSILQHTGAPNPAFLSYPDFFSGMKATTTAISDFDGDGKVDLVFASPDSHMLSFFRNRVNEASILPSGTNPVNGNILQTLTIDTSVQVYNGYPYVQRHYDITPQNNAATATATITLFYSQNEFDLFNAHPNHGLDLPKNPADIANKANLRIFQYHGFSATSQPGTYSGTGVEINPDDNLIIWNPTAKWWEVTFNVTGFSGFFLGTLGNSMVTGTIVIDNTHFIKLAPNPVTTDLWLHYNLSFIQNVDIDILDIQGKLVKSMKNLSSGTQISVADLPNSLYFFRVRSPRDKKQYLLKFIKQ